MWYGRVGTTSCIPSEKVQQLFNDMQLYPSKSQGNSVRVVMPGVGVELEDGMWL